MCRTRTTFKLFRKCNSFCSLFFSLYFLFSSQVSESAAVSGAEEGGSCADCKLAPPDGEFGHCANCERAPPNGKSVQCAKCETAPSNGKSVQCAKCKTAPPHGKSVHCMKCDQRKRRQAVPDNKAPAVLYLPLGKNMKNKPVEERICKCRPCSIATFVQTSWNFIQGETRCMRPTPEVTITSPYVNSRVNSNTCTKDNPFVRVDNKPYARVDFIPQPGTKNLAVGTSITCPCISLLAVVVIVFSLRGTENQHMFLKYQEKTRFFLFTAKNSKINYR